MKRGLQEGRKPCGKKRNCSLRTISPFPTVISKDLYCRHVKTRACLGKPVNPCPLHKYNFCFCKCEDEGL